MNFFGSIIYLSISDLPGGEVGMLPFGIALVSGISALIAIAIELIITVKVNVSFKMSIIIYHLVYFGLLIYNGLSFSNEDGLSALDFAIVSIAIFIGVIIVAINEVNSQKRMISKE